MLSQSSEFEFILDSENNHITIKTTNGKYNMVGLSSEEYLNLPELFASRKPNYEEGVTEDQCYFSGAEMSFLASSTHFAVSTDDFRPMMSGVYFQFRGDHVNAVATDSYRLVKATIKRESSDFQSELNVIIPSRAIDLLRKVNNELWLSFVKSNDKITHLRFDIGDMVFISRIIDETFPAYEGVIPSEDISRAFVSKSDLVKSLKRVALFASSTTNQVKFLFEDNKLVLSGADDDLGTDASETINVEYEGENLEIGFNVKYVEEALSHLDPKEDDTVYIQFSGANKPFLIMPEKNSEELLNLIMPVRL
jgi:DNA polymerase-3 subunit beta